MAAVTCSWEVGGGVSDEGGAAVEPQAKHKMQSRVAITQEGVREQNIRRQRTAVRRSAATGASFDAASAVVSFVRSLHREIAPTPASAYRVTVQSDNAQANEPR